MLKWFINTVIKAIAHILLKIDARELTKVPMKGPLLAVANHVNFLDAPVVIVLLHPRPTTGFVKKESWDNPLHAFLFNVWGGIPIDRDIADFSAFRKAKEALQEGKILAVAPEGTRTHDGRMIRGKPGIAILARQCDVPILPVALYGHKDFKENLKRFKRSPMHIRVGKPFKINWEGKAKDKETLQTVTDAIMLEVAAMLPEDYHGAYAEISVDRKAIIEPLA
jgi:1-acyl-sn-glycerol-3-phosphate acyltransferase